MGDRDLITKARELLGAAEPGPWHVCPMGLYVMRTGYGMVADTIDYNDEAPPEALARIRGTGRGAPQQQNLQLIAAAPDLVNALADEVERLRAGTDAARAELLALLDAHDDALLDRQHGGVAADRLVDGVRKLLGVGGFERRRGARGEGGGASA